MALSLIVFDCDGVILESVDAKTKAFGQVAEPLGAEARDRLLLYHTLHGGVSRREKLHGSTAKCSTGKSRLRKWRTAAPGSFPTRWTTS